MQIENSIRRAMDRVKYFFENLGFVKKNVHANDDRDFELLYEIQPTGGIKFHDTYSVLGDGYMKCIQIYSVPTSLVRNWMFQLCNKSNIITTIDVHTIDKAEAEDNLNKAINEYDSRINDNNASTKRSVEKESINTYARLDKLLDELTIFGDSLKVIVPRMYVYAPTFSDLEENTMFTEQKIDEDGYSKYATNVNESAFDYKSFFMSFSDQEKTLSARKGIPCPSNIAAYGLPYHYVGWLDERGFYLGDTPVSAGEGAVIFDPYALSDHRNSYDGVIFGEKGSGKSTTLKQLIEWQITTGNKVRIIDVTSEFKDITEKYGGIVINMDGSGGKLNPLQILRMEEDDSKNYMMHISKMGVMYQLKNPNATQEIVDLYKSFLKEVYLSKGVISLTEDGETLYDGCTSLAPKAYPIYSDVQRALNKRLLALEKEAKEKQSARLQIQKYLEIKATVDDIVNNYGSIFDGATSIVNLMDADIICFDIRAVSDMESSIFDMQLFNVLTMAYDSCMNIGIDMKRKYDRREIDMEDIIHHTIYIDECHKTINSRKLFAVRRMLDILRQDRKYFIGVWLATQNIADMFPNSSEISDELKTLFSLCQYKMIFKQDDAAVELISKVLGSRITPYQLRTIPQFGKRECLLTVGLNTIQMICKKLDSKTLSYYGGGA